MIGIATFAKNAAAACYLSLSIPMRMGARLGARAAVLLVLTLSASVALAQGLNLVSGDIVVVNPLVGPCTGGSCSYGGQGAVLQVKPDGSAQGVIASNTPSDQYPNGLLQAPVGVIVDPNDSNLLVADRYRGVIRVNPFDGTQTLLSTGNFFQDPFSLTLDGLGKIYVADSGLRGTSSGYEVNVPGQIILVNRTTGAQTLLASRGFIAHPYGIAYDPRAMTLYVSSFDDVAGTGSIVAVNPNNGSQTLIWGTAGQCAASGNSNCAVQQDPIACPMGLAVEATGNIITTAFNVAPYGCGNPGIMRVRLDTHPYSQSNLSVNPPVAWQIPFGIATEADGSILALDEYYAALYRLRGSDGSFINPTPLSAGGVLGYESGPGPTGLSVVRVTPIPH